MIYYVKTIYSHYQMEFDHKLNEAIDAAQDDRLTVEVQFSTNDHGFSALIIVRRPAS